MAGKKQYKYDVILVLGVSLKKRLFKARVNKAVELYKKGVAPKIIFSGRWWWRIKKKPRKTEARYMFEYAKSQGIPDRDVFLEENSTNTVANFYFTKKKILEPHRFFRLIIIIHSSHFAKARYLAKKVLGPNYCFRFLSDGTKIPSAIQGHIGLSEMKKLFDEVKDGDDQAIVQVIKRHPYYSKYKHLLL